MFLPCAVFVLFFCFFFVLCHGIFSQFYFSIFVYTIWKKRRHEILVFAFFNGRGVKKSVLFSWLGFGKWSTIGCRKAFRLFFFLGSKSIRILYIGFFGVRGAKKYSIIVVVINNFYYYVYYYFSVLYIISRKKSLYVQGSRLHGELCTGSLVRGALCTLLHGLVQSFVWGLNFLCLPPSFLYCLCLPLRIPFTCVIFFF